MDFFTQASTVPLTHPQSYYYSFPLLNDIVSDALQGHYVMNNFYCMFGMSTVFDLKIETIIAINIDYSLQSWSNTESIINLYAFAYV